MRNFFATYSLGLTGRSRPPNTTTISVAAPVIGLQQTITPSDTKHSSDLQTPAIIDLLERAECGIAVKWPSGLDERVAKIIQRKRAGRGWVNREAAETSGAMDASSLSGVFRLATNQRRGARGEYSQVASEHRSTEPRGRTNDPAARGTDTADL